MTGEPFTESTTTDTTTLNTELTTTSTEPTFLVVDTEIDDNQTQSLPFALTTEYLSPIVVGISTVTAVTTTLTLYFALRST